MGRRKLHQKLHEALPPAVAAACIKAIAALRGSARDLGAEAAVAFALVVGWALVTLGIGRIAPARIVWPISAGLFLLSCAGWSLILTIARDGLYALTAAERERARKATTNPTKARG